MDCTEIVPVAVPLDSVELFARHCAILHSKTLSMFPNGFNTATSVFPESKEGHKVYTVQSLWTVVDGVSVKQDSAGKDGDSEL